MKKIISFGILSVSLISLVGCGNQSASNSKEQSITAVGSTAMQPLVEKASNDYAKGNINVQGGKSGTGLSQVSQGTASIGNSDIFAEQSSGVDKDKIKDNKVAVVGMAPVVNPSTGVKNLSSKQLREIFAGKITNWKQVGGKNEKVTIINRTEGSGTRVTFESTALKNSKVIKSQSQDSNGAVEKVVAKTPGTISYLSLPYLQNNQKLQVVSINNVKPSYSNITSNKWKIWSYEHMYTQKKTNQAVKDFIDYLQSKKVQNGLVKDAGYVSIHDMNYKALANGNVIKK